MGRRYPQQKLIDDYLTRCTATIRFRLCFSTLAPEIARTGKRTRSLATEQIAMN